MSDTKLQELRKRIVYRILRITEELQTGLARDAELTQMKTKIHTYGDVLNLISELEKEPDK